MRPAGVGARIAGGGASVVFSGLRRLTGLDLLEDLSEFFGATAGMIGGFRERAERVNGLLAAEGTRFVIVCGPASDSIEEAVFLRDKLAEGDLPLGGVVVNRVHSGAETAAAHADAAAELGELIEDPDLVARIVAAAAAQRSLAERDEANVGGLAARTGEAPLLRVPELGGEIHDLAGLLSLDPYLFGVEGSAG